MDTNSFSPDVSNIPLTPKNTEVYSLHTKHGFRHLDNEPVLEDLSSSLLKLKLSTGPTVIDRKSQILFQCEPCTEFKQALKDIKKK